MKRFLVIPVMFLYLLAMSGVRISLHYCGSQLASWNVFLNARGCGNGDCGDEQRESHKCCKDKIILAKVSQDQHYTHIFSLQPSLATAEALPAFFDFHTERLYSPYIRQLSNQPNAPPGRWENIPLYKLHGSLTFYS